MSSLQYRNIHFVLKKVSENGFNLRHAKSFADDIDVVTLAIQSRGSALQYASERFRGDRKIVTLALQNDGTAIGFAATALKNDVELALIAVQQNGTALRYVGEESRRQIEVTKAAVCNDGLALELADEGFKKDVDIVALAVQQNPRSIQYAHPAILCANPNNVVTDALTADASILSLLLGRVKLSSDAYLRPFFRTVARWNADAIVAFPKSVILAEERMLKDEILPAQPELLKNLPAVCRKNEELVLAAVTAKGTTLQYAPHRLRRSRSVVEAAVQNSGEALQFASSNLQEDEGLQSLVATK